MTTQQALDYTDWLDAVDQFVMELFGISVHQLPEWPSARLFEQEVSPKQAARIAINLAEGI